MTEIEEMENKARRLWEDLTKYWDSHYKYDDEYRRLVKVAHSHEENLMKLYIKIGWGRPSDTGYKDGYDAYRGAEVAKIPTEKDRSKYWLDEYYEGYAEGKRAALQ